MKITNKSYAIGDYLLKLQASFTSKIGAEKAQVKLLILKAYVPNVVNNKNCL